NGPGWTACDAETCDDIRSSRDGELIEHSCSPRSSFGQIRNCSGYVGVIIVFISCSRSKKNPVGLGPNGAVRGVIGHHRYELASPYSIASSARASSLSGIWRPSALAVLRLSTNSNLVGWMIGRSAGFSPLRMRPALGEAFEEMRKVELLGERDQN